MWLILSEADDASAIWAFRGLKSRGIEPLVYISSEVIAYSLRWEHRLDGNETNIKIDLADGHVIKNDTVNGILNRLFTIPQKHLQVANPKDRDYAIQELASFFMSWLNCFDCPVFNPPTPHGLSGHFRHASEWAFLASRAGLPTPTYKQSSADKDLEIHPLGKLVSFPKSLHTVLILRGRTTGATIPEELLAGCKKLSELANTPLLGVDFTPDETGAWVFVGATPSPDLRLGGEEFLDELAAELTSGHIK
jgi:hypothetical protein